MADISGGVARWHIDLLQSHRLVKPHEIVSVRRFGSCLTA